MCSQHKAAEAGRAHHVFHKGPRQCCQVRPGAANSDVQQRVFCNQSSQLVELQLLNLGLETIDVGGLLLDNVVWISGHGRIEI